MGIPRFLNKWAIAKNPKKVYNKAGVKNECKSNRKAYWGFGDCIGASQ
jgi:hypothetical protein